MTRKYITNIAEKIMYVASVFVGKRDATCASSNKSEKKIARGFLPTFFFIKLIAHRVGNSKRVQILENTFNEIFRRNILIKKYRLMWRVDGDIDSRVVSNRFRFFELL